MHSPEGTQIALRGTSEGTHLFLIHLHRNAIPQQLAELLGTNLTATVGVNEAKKHFCILMMREANQ